MTLHFLNCGSMRPYFPRVENGVTCFLIETNQGPVLVVGNHMSLNFTRNRS